MNLKRIYAIVLRQYFLISANPTRFMQYFFWVAIDIVLWGFISKYLTTVGGGALSFASLFLGAVVLSDFLARVMLGITTAFFEDLWSRNFLNIFASPLSLAEYISGLVLSSVGTTTLAFAVMVPMAFLFFGFSIFSFGLPLVAFLFVLFLFGIALGMFAVGVVLRFGPSAEWFIWPIPTLIAPFVGVFYPIAVLPQAMQIISYVLPPSYVFEGMRAIIQDGTFSLAGFLTGTALALVYIALSYRFLHSIHRYTIRSGLLARYSAETAGS